MAQGLGDWHGHTLQATIYQQSKRMHRQSNAGVSLLFALCNCQSTQEECNKRLSILANNLKTTPIVQILSGDLWQENAIVPSRPYKLNNPVTSHSFSTSNHQDPHTIRLSKALSLDHISYSSILRVDPYQMLGSPPFMYVLAERSAILLFHAPNSPYLRLWTFVQTLYQNRLTSNKI